MSATAAKEVPAGEGGASCPARAATLRMVGGMELVKAGLAPTSGDVCESHKSPIIESARSCICSSCCSSAVAGACMLSGGRCSPGGLRPGALHAFPPGPELSVGSAATPLYTAGAGAAAASGVMSAGAVSRGANGASPPPGRAQAAPQAWPGAKLRGLELAPTIGGGVAGGDGMTIPGGTA
eukprot:scaffold9266_cov110-Isochrysis_galbana.AAC.5